MLVLMRQCDLVQLVGSLEDEEGQEAGCLKQGQVFINVKKEMEALDNVDDFKVAHSPVQHEIEG